MLCVSVVVPVFKFYLHISIFKMTVCLHFKKPHCFRVCYGNMSCFVQNLGRTDLHVHHFIRGLIKILYFKTKTTGKARKFLVKQATKSWWSAVTLSIPWNTAVDGQWSRGDGACGTNPWWLVSDMFCVGFTWCFVSNWGLIRLRRDIWGFMYVWCI